jgi:ATP-binding cassette subfamily B protein/ATP-binding cassette subfamily C protein
VAKWWRLAGTGEAASEPEWAELAPPSWDAHGSTYVATSFRAMARRIPALVREAWRVAWAASPRAAVSAVALQVGAGVLTGVGLLATTGVLQALIAGGPTPERVRAAVPALALVVAARAARSALEIAAGWAQARLSPLVDLVAERRLFELTTKVDLVAFDDPAFDESMRRARDRGVDSAARVVDAVVDVVTGAVGLAAAAGTLGLLHPLLLPLLVFAALPHGWASVRAARIEYLAMIAEMGIRRRKWILSDLMADRHTAAEVRAYTAGGYLLGRYAAVARRETAAHLRVARQQSTARAAGAVLAGLASGLVYLTLGLLLIHGVVPLPAAGTAMLAIQTGQGALATLIRSTNSLYENGLYFVDYLDFCAEAERRAAGGGTGPPGQPELITVTDVTFCYPGQDQPAVRGVSVEIHRGQIVALVGENGSGKTTLARLIAGLYQPDAGRICWDGVPVPAAGTEQVCRQVALVPQDYVRWPFTAGDNILIGRHDHPDPQPALDRAAEAAGADRVIATLPNGYRTLLDRAFKGGHELSSGQWQRLAVARGFFRDAGLLICDEPTAALDARAEHAVYTRLRQLAAGRTVLLITHRLASVRHADHIYVLDRGQVLEHGTHDQLIARNGRYAELFALQAAGYADHAGPAPDAA